MNDMPSNHVPEVIIIKVITNEDEGGVPYDMETKLLLVQYHGHDDESWLRTELAEVDALEFVQLLPSIAPDYNWDALRKLAGLQVCRWLYNKGLLSPAYDYNVELFLNESVVGLYTGVALFRSSETWAALALRSPEIGDSAPWARALL